MVEGTSLLSQLLTFEELYPTTLMNLYSNYPVLQLFHSDNYASS